MFWMTPAARQRRRGSMPAIGVTPTTVAAQRRRFSALISSGGRASRSTALFKKATERKYGSIARRGADAASCFLGREEPAPEVHVIIAGCGRVGSELASNLERLGHSVAVIDKNTKAFERLKAGFSGRQIIGFAFDREILEEAGIKEAAAFASVTNGDNSNILSARVAKEHYRVPQVVARIYDPRRAQIYQRLGIQTVATVRWTTDQIMRHLLPEDVSVEHTVDNGEVVVAAIPAPSETVGKRALSLEVLGERRLVALSRFGVPRIPDKDLTVQEGDILHMSVVRSAAPKVAEELRKAGEPE
jgi:trk/ktr system potassium uptake protein